MNQRVTKIPPNAISRTSMLFNIIILLVLVTTVIISWYVYSKTNETTECDCESSNTKYVFSPDEVRVPYDYMFWLSLLLTVLLVLYVVGIYIRWWYINRLNEAIYKKQKQMKKKLKQKRI